MHKVKYPKSFIATAVLFFIVTFIFLAICNIVYTNGRQMYRHGVTELHAAYEIRSATGSISNAMQTVRLQGMQMATITSESEAVEKGKELAESLKQTSATLEKNVAIMEAAIERCRKVPNITNEERMKIEETAQSIETLKTACSNVLFSTKQQGKVNQEDSAAITASMMGINKSLEEAVQICRAETDIEMTNSRKFHIISDFMMLFISVIGCIAILIIGGKVKQNEEEILRRKLQIEYQEERIEKANQKTKDIAYTDLILDCGNRHALANYLDEKFREGSEFFSCKLMIGNYDEVLAMMGYEELDKYFSLIATRLRETYGNYGELFTVSGRDFVFVFNNDVAQENVLTFTEDMRGIASNFAAVTTYAVSVPIASAVALSSRYFTKGPNSMLVAMNTGCANSRMTGQTQFM